MQYSSHQPILIDSLIIGFGNKECINKPFNNMVYYGEKIGIIGRNGSGKSSLIKVLAGLDASYDGDIIVPHDVVSGYIPQLIINNDSQLSGGERFNQQFSQILSLHPNLLLLDEPTNHLDRHNRDALFRLLNHYHGTLIAITHDVELLNFVDTIWHVANGSVTVFNGSYSEYILKQKQEWNNLTNTVKQLNYEKRQAHQQLMREQQRTSHSHRHGEKCIKERKWATIKSATKMGRGVTLAGKNNKRIEKNKQNAVVSLQELYVPEVIVPNFNLETQRLNASKTILNIENGAISYQTNNIPILTNINLQIGATEKVALLGINGCGKSTLIKAILDDSSINKLGSWWCTCINDIGYIDQHYSGLDNESTSVELLQQLMPNWSHAEIRNHLNTFLLRKNQEVNLAVKYLSGGEKVRLNLALIAAHPPKLLILDEITNNIDLETKEHLIQVLCEYPGSMILICHDQNFVDSIAIDSYYVIENTQLHRK